MATVNSEPVIEPVSTVFPEAVKPAPAKADEPLVLLDRLPLYRLTIDQYQGMAEHGILEEKSKVHLIDGYLVAKMTKNPPHIIAGICLNRLLVRIVPDGWHVSSEDPLLLPPHGFPEPDFMIVRGNPNDYSKKRVGAADIALVVEISDSTLRIDQTVMKALYAAAAISEYWIVNLIDRRIEVYTDPTGPDTSPDYRRRQDFGPGTTIPLRVDSRGIAQIAVDEVLPFRPEE